MKRCSKCGEEKELSEFYADKSKKNNVGSLCKNCAKEKGKERYKNNKEKCDKKNKEWAEKNKVANIRIKARYRENNRDKLRISEARRRKEHPEYSIEWRQKNRDRINKDRREKRQSDDNYKLKCYLRSRISSIISGSLKGGSAIGDLGCSIDELKIHLECKFTDGMCWDNYGEWHIDHIKPLASFDLTDREQFLQACHYANLQPLWAKDNLSKGAKISEEFGNV